MLEKLEYIRDLLKSCFVPALRQDLDSIPLKADDFAEYQKVLELQLPLVYDFVQQHDRWIFESNDQEIQEVYACLIVLLAELTANDAIYKLNRTDLLNNARKLLTRRITLTDAVDDIVFNHYQEKLHKDCWKRQVGAVHSFMRFLECRHNENSSEMTTKWLSYSLSVGLTVRESHEPTYKQIGIRIFQIVLHHAKYEDIHSMNIHSVVYADTFKDVHFMDNVVSTAEIWSCLFSCLEYFEGIDSFNWNQVDDMLEILLRNISLVSDSLISICILKFITKLGYFFAYQRRDIESVCNSDLSKPDVLEKCRDTCSGNTSHTIFRWAKSILNVLIFESYKLKQSPSICKQLLQEIHRCYMVFILPIPMQVIEPHLINFCEKYTTILIETIAVQKNEHCIVQLVKNLLETIQRQMRTPYCDNNVKCQHLINAYGKLFHLDLFVKGT